METRDCRKYILRVSLPQGGHNRDHVAAEMAWLEVLARDTCISVPRPVSARNGSMVVEAEAVGVSEARLCAVFSWVPGTDLAGHISPGNLLKLGELMAQLHIQAQDFQPPTSLSLLSFDRVFPFPEPVVLFDEQFAAFFPPERRSAYEQAIAWAQLAIDRLKASGEPMRILHGDLHQWNVRLFRGVLSPIDFEDLMWGWPVQDIATTLYYFLDESDYSSLRAAFEEGYSRWNPWPERYPGEINAFVAARGVGLANFILNDPSPEWKNQASEFIERVETRLRGLVPDLLAG